MTRWHLHLYDGQGNRLAALDNLTEASAERRIAEAGSVSWSLPAEHPRAGELSLARSWRLYRGAEPVASGRLIARQIAESPWRYEGLTNEVELERIHYPALWGELYRGWDLADVVRDLLRERRVYRRNTLAHWQAAVEAVNVDLQAHLGYVTLARDPYLDGFRYRGSGYITLQFDAPGGLWTWERARWSEIVGEDVRITLQYRTSQDGGQTWSAWSPELDAVDAEDVQMNEQVGVLLSGTGGTLQLRVNLYTDDRDTPFYDELPPDTQQTYGRTPILTGLEAMDSRPGPVHPHPSDFPAGSAGVTIPDPPDWSDANALAALQDLYELTGWEWYVDGENRIHLAKQLGVDRTGDFMLREGTNIRLEVLEDDDEEIVNVLTVRGAGEGYAQLQVVLRDEQSIADHDGVEYHRVVEWGEIDDPAELEARAQEYLEQHAYAQPRMRARIVSTVREDAPTPLSTLSMLGGVERVQQMPQPATGRDPVLDLGDTVRVVHPRSRTIVQARVLDIQRAITSEGEEWRVGLNASWDQGSLVDRLSGRPGPEQRKVLAVPTLTAQGYFEGVRLSLAGPKPYRVQHTARFDASGNPTAWRDLEALTEAQVIDHAPLEFASRHAYRARSVIDGRPGLWTEPVVALAKDAQAPATPTDLAVETGPGKIARLSWTQNPESDVTEYRIYRRAGSFPSDPTGAAIIAEEAGTVHVDTSGSYGQEYTWYISAVDRDENESPLSTGVVATIPQTGAGDIDQTPSAPLAGIALSVSEQVLYQNAEGHWFVRARLSFSNVPADARRAYIQIKHRRQGSTTYRLDDQLAVASGSATAYVDDLLPNVSYEYAAVPVSHFGVAGTGKTASATTPKDSQPPAVPTGLVVEAHKLGAKARWNANTEPDLAGYRVQYRLDGGAWATVFVGADTERLVQADPGVLVEFQLRAEDTSENVSAYSPIQGATAQALDGGDYGDGTVDTVHIVQDAVSGLEILEVIDNTGAQTTSQSFVDIPGFAINVTLEQPATVLLYYTLDAYADNTASGVYGVQVDARLLVDGVPTPGSDRILSRVVVGHVGGGPDQWVFIRGTLAAVTAKELSAGSHTIKAQFRVGTASYIDPSKTRATAFHRILGAQIFKR